MTNPVYKYNQSQEGQNLDQGAASTLLQMLGKQGTGLPSIQTAPVTAGQPVQG